MSMSTNQSCSPMMIKEFQHTSDSPGMSVQPSPDRQKGCYVLILVVHRRTRFRAGARGVVCLSRGAYAYVGSAMRGLNARISRHLRPERRHRWHIDYLLDHALPWEIVAACCERNIECDVSRRLLEQWPVVDRFGSSDCRCPGHLFGSAPLKKLRSSVCLAFSDCGLDPQPWRMETFEVRYSKFANSIREAP